MRKFTITVEHLLMLNARPRIHSGPGNVTITDSIVAFGNQSPLLKTKVANLDTNIEFYTKVIIGLAQQKAQARRDLPRSPLP